MAIDYEYMLQYNREANERIIELYYRLCEQKREEVDLRLMYQAQQHLYQQLRYYTDYIPGNWYTPEEYTSVVLTTMLTMNADVYPYLSGQYGYGCYAEHFNHLLTTGTVWYKQHLYWPTILQKPGTQLRLFNH